MATPIEIKIMALCLQTSFLSPDPNCKQGALLVNNDKCVIMSNINSPPTDMPVNAIDYKCSPLWIVSAVKNLVGSIHQCNLKSLYNLNIYSTHYPTLSDIKRAYEVGLKEVVHYFPQQNTTENEEITEYCKLTNFKIIQFKGNLNWARDRWNMFLE